MLTILIPKYLGSEWTLKPGDAMAFDLMCLVADWNAPGTVVVGVSIVMGIPPYGWFLKENPIEKDDLGIPLFQENQLFVWDNWDKWDNIYNPVLRL